MYLPRHPVVAQNHGTFFDIHFAGVSAGGWSSLIGIITAIIGNVLISFALNTQRYAHIRLAREREQQEDAAEQDQKRGSSRSYGTQQTEIADERAQINAKSNTATNGYADYQEIDGTEATESDPLIPSLPSRKSSVSGDSESTVRPSTKSTDSAGEKSYLHSPYWWLGISLMVVGEAGNFLAYGFAPASIVSPLGVVALVVNCLIAPWMLHENFRKRDGLGVLIAIAGAVTVVLSASDSNPKLAPDKIWDLITTWEFETYLGITIFLILVLMVGSNTEFGERSILVDLGLVGLFGGYTALSTKGVASLLSNTLWHAITFPITYLLLAILVSTAIMQIKYLNRALQRFDSTQVIPTQFVLFTISVILGSAVLYRDFERQTTQDAIKFVAGCALTFFGVWLITSGRKQGKEEDEESLLEDDAINLVDETGQQPEIREREDGNAHLRNVRSNTPSLIITSNDTESQSATFGGPSPIYENPFAGALPNNISSVHALSAETLPATTSKGGQKQPPRMHATTSAPIIPTSSTLTPDRPVTPRQRTTAWGEGAARIISPRSPSQRPQEPENAPGRKRSIASMLPGPLVTPLSSSLSAIVADSLRRGMDRPRTMERRRTTRRSVRPQRSFAAGDNRPTTTDGDFTLRLTATADAAASRNAATSYGPKTRGRSFSDYFQARRSRANTLESDQNSQNEQ